MGEGDCQGNLRDTSNTQHHIASLWPRELCMSILVPECPRRLLIRMLKQLNISLKHAIPRPAGTTEPPEQYLKDSKEQCIECLKN